MMKILRSILIPIIAGLAIAIIIELVKYSSYAEYNLYQIGKYKLLTKLTLIWLCLILMLIASYIISYIIKGKKKSNKIILNKEDRKRYLLSFLNDNHLFTFIIIYYKAINKKIKIKIDKKKDHISYVTVKDNLHGGASFKDFVKYLFKFQEKNIIKIKSTDPLSFKINKEYKNIIIDIYNEK